MKKLIFIIIVLMCCSQFGYSEPEYPLARNMAIINANTYVKENDITVKRFTYLLNRISSKCKNSKEDISDILVRVQQVLRDKYGVNVKLLELTEAGNQALPDNAQNSIDFAEVMVILMQQYKKRPWEKLYRHRH